MERGSRGDARTLKEPEVDPHPLRAVVIQIRAEDGVADEMRRLMECDGRILLIGPEADVWLWAGRAEGVRSVVVLGDARCL